MQPTIPQSTGGSDMDLPAVQPMDWLFKKERIYLLAQFWQQRATLAEKEVNSLKEKLSTTDRGVSNNNNNNISNSVNNNDGNDMDVTAPPPPPSLSAPTLPPTSLPLAASTSPTPPTSSSPMIVEQNGIAPPSPSTTPVSESGSIHRPEVALSPSEKPLGGSRSPMTVSTRSRTPEIDRKVQQELAALAHTINNNCLASSNNNHNSNNRSPTRSPPATSAEKMDCESASALQSKGKTKDGFALDELSSSSVRTSVSECHKGSSEKLNNSTDTNCTSSGETESPNKDPILDSRTRSLTEELSAKDREISLLFEEVGRLRTAIANIQESHNLQIQRLEDRLEEKRQHIVRLESRIEKQQDFDDIKKENSMLRSVDLSASHESKQFQELLLERTKALAAQTEAIKSSSTTSEDLPTLAHHAAGLDQDKASSHHENSSSASTPILREETSRHDDRHLNGGGGLTPMSISKSPLEDNNNTLGALSRLDGAGSGNLIQGLPFQFQERGHFRFADASDMQMPPGSMVGRLGDSLIPKGDPMEAKLQEMLRYNMDKYANQNLDTLHISRRVRELLSVHNIGQRLFAKYVLGLSQGTVSELLSKPKPWDKLTEKGRDSYRKMHAWACDENAIMLLKSLIPKKGAEPGMPSYGRPDGDLSDDRMQQILSEASMMKRGEQPTPQQQAHHQQQMREQMQLQQHQLQQLHLSGLDDSTQHSDNDSKSPHNRDVHSPFSKDYLSGRLGSTGRPKKYDNDDISQDKIAKIYQEEFSKLMRSPREFPNLLFPHFLSGGMPPMDRVQDDNLRMAFEAYHRELAKLQQNASAALPGMPNISNLPNFLALQHQQQQQQQQPSQPSTPSGQPSTPSQPSQHATTGLNGGSAQDLSLPKDKQSSSSKLNGTISDAESDADMSQKELDESMKHSAFSLVKPKPSEPSGICTPTTTASSAAPSPIGNSILPPTITPTDDFSVAASPLQRMASITNSLITQPPVTPHHTTQQRPLKAILPPITQQQFDLYNNLNTEDIVRRVKESLSQYSISQRLFGESVLGLSQGSVSDLLARPKPWHMLTQKGREPFIRMKMFLEDENAVHKLVASQYKIAPEKLMRTGNYSGTPQLPGLHMQKQMPPTMPKMLSDSLSKLQQDQQKTLLQLQISQMQQQLPTAQAAQAAAQHQHQLAAAAAAAAAAHHAAQVQEVQRHSAQQPPSSQPSPLGAMGSQNSSSQQRPQQPSPQTMLLTPPGIPPQHAIALQGHPGTQEKKSSIMMPIHSPVPQGPPVSVGQHASQPGAPNSMRGSLHQHISPTVYEMAALTQDLDTQVITTKIKEALLANNIGQKIFGEAVLGLSQGSVSELLSKPKPWHMLSIKGREPFIRMQLWLSDANNVERLQVLKNERREASKRRRSTGPGGQDNSSDTSSNDTSEFYHSNSPGPGSVGSATAPPNKKQRVLFSEEQKEALRLAFALDPYPNVQTIEFLASELGLSTRTITNWFHNHRMRLKQQVPHGQPSEPIPSRENQSGAPFDPVQFRVLLGQRLMEIQKERLGLSGMPLPYPPYFAATAPATNLAALIGRGFMPGSEADLAALNKSISEQMSGLDLSMPSTLKREGDDDYEDDAENEEEAGSGHMSDSESMDGSSKRGGDDDDLKTSLSLASLQAMSRISRRKPAAPQWVNPDWQDPEKKTSASAATAVSNIPSAKKDAADAIINGVCVLQPPDGVPSVQQRFAAAMAAAAAAAVAAATGAGATVPSQSQDDPSSDAENEDDDAKSTHSKHSSYGSDGKLDEDRPRTAHDESESEAPSDALRPAEETARSGGSDAAQESNGNRSGTASPASSSVTVKKEILEDNNGDRWDAY
ncbi:homeobox protein cut isoform X3 [Anopheles funestus]|uniref:homeobox protein cut isoform X3 n=1 Tax=Anopheles funestus TaxID=62324 RepID=UPI0020C5E1CB|nr:homeobox protein cut isoform X3 [Anopheles funestus]